ncbi:MAG: methyltransferase, partial [Paracoccaceae bacterium]|nr:methyltransferase [Paracoccaceae bacterium]
MFTAADLTDDAFLGGKLRLWQPKKGYRAATDPVLLAACTPAKAGQSVLDMGCGAGTAALCLAVRVPGLVLAGLELQPAYAELARRNAARAAIALDVAEGNVMAMPKPLKRGFDHVISNPPYYPPVGTPSPDPARATALREDVALGDWIGAASRRLTP